MTDQQYQLYMPRSGKAPLLRSQGPHHNPNAAAVRDARALDLYPRSSYVQNPGRLGKHSEYIMSVPRAQLMSDRRSSLPGAYIDANQSYVNNSNSRILPTRVIAAEAAEVFPYPSSARPLVSSISSSALGAADFLQTRRADIASAYGHSPARGAHLGRLGRLDDSVTSKEGLRTSGAYGGLGKFPMSSYEDQELTASRLAAMQHGVLGSGEGARKARDMERYLLAVQPEKLVRYAATCLSPEPAVKRARLAMMANNVAPPPELDVYSNYRQAKLRRTAAIESNIRQERRTDRPGRDRDRSFGTGSGSGLNQRRKEKERGESNQEKRSKSDENTRGSDKKGDGSKDVRSANDSEVPKRDNGNVSQVHNSSGGGSHISQKQTSIQNEGHQETGKEDTDNLDSDKDSELGSLGADLSDFDDENDLKKKKSKELDTVIDAPLDGMIFGCSSTTFYECMRLKLFGLPTKNKDDVMRVAPGTKLFLFNFDTKELSGIFEAISHGGMMVQPDAFREFGSFPAQVQVTCAEQCPNIHLSDFKNIIKDNFVSSFKFKFTLNSSQVKDLIKLFRRAARIQPQIQQRQESSLLRRYTHEPISSSEDYMLSSHHSRQSYSQHSQASFGLSSNSYASKVKFLSTKSKLHHGGSSRRGPRERRKKRKVVKECPDSPKADNCSSLKQPEEMDDKPDITKHISESHEDVVPSNISVLDGKVIVTDNSQKLKKTVEAADTMPNSKGTDPPEQNPDICTSEHELLLGLQSEDCDGKQVSFIEGSSNSGKCGLAGERSEEQGKGHNVQRGALDSHENVTRDSDCSATSIGMEEDLSAAKTPEHLVDLFSSSKKDMNVASNVPPEEEKGQPLEGTSEYDGVVLEHPEENQNISVRCSAILSPQPAREVPVKDSADDSEEEYDEEIVYGLTDDEKRLMDSSTADSMYTSTNVSDSSLTLVKDGREDKSEQLDTVCENEKDHLASEPLVSNHEECLNQTGQDKPEEGGRCKEMNLDVNSNYGNMMNSCHSNDGPASGTKSMCSKAEEDEEMVSIDFDDVRCEDAKTQEAVKAVNFLKVDEVEEVDVSEPCERGALEDMIQGMDNIISAAKGQSPGSDSTEILETETEFVFYKFYEAEDEEDIVDYGSSSEATHENEDEDELALVREVYGDMPEEAESEDQEQTLKLSEAHNGERHEIDQDDEYLSLPEASSEDEDLADTVDTLADSGQEVLQQESK
ncbi:hypothetical protein R1flu_004496 [Riccia fluitans]|uniref:DCD domain-containing protein n=1 Tax=Riccia fluitans TaxID=41844 RepID=A0ABD1YQG6_9MARC